MKLRKFRAAILIGVIAGALGLGISYIRLTKSTDTFALKNQLIKHKTLRDLIAKNSEQREIKESAEVDFPLLKQERFYTEEEINEMSEMQFSALLQTIELRLPKVSEIKKLPPGALHHTPELIMIAGKDLGLIKEILKVHESYELVAQGFYKTCAQDSERPTPVRALCLTNLIEIKKKNGEKINEKDYPPTIVELTKVVTDL